MRLLLTAALTFACCTVTALAADEAATPKSGARDALKARIAAEETKARSSQPAPRPAAPAPAPATASAKVPAAPAPSTPIVPAPASSAAQNVAPASATPTTAAKADTSSEPVSATASTATTAAKGESDTDALLLPRVDVRRDPIEIKEQYDRIYEQEKKILVEKRKTRATETDKALNAPRVSKALSVFGGESSDYRANLAKERVSLMEEEKDLMEAMVLVKTPEEKKELQKQIDELRALRRDLEKSLR